VSETNDHAADRRITFNWIAILRLLCPRQNLPDEYEDWRPVALKCFKDRMKAEGLWPIAKAD
jgi:hypothetical protein